MTLFKINHTSALIAFTPLIFLSLKLCAYNQMRTEEMAYNRQNTQDLILFKSKCELFPFTGRA